MQILKNYRNQILSFFLAILGVLAAFFHGQAEKLEKEEKFYDNKVHRLKRILSLMTRDINIMSAYISNLKKLQTLVNQNKVLFVDYTHALNVYNQIMAIALLSSNKNKITLIAPKIKDYEFSFFIEIKDPTILNDFLKNFLLREKKLFAKIIDYKEDKNKFYTKLKIYFLVQEQK